MCREEVRAVKKYKDLSRIGDSVYRQKSRVQWLNLGDQKTKVFFKTMKNHHSRRKIVLVCRENSTRIEDPNEVKSKIAGYF
jgi:hypothetical protein